MKVSQIMKIMKQAKVFWFYQNEEVIAGQTYRRGPQWVSDGAAFYCLEGVPEIRTESQFFAAYDVKERQQESFNIQFEPLPYTLRSIERWNGSETARPQKLTVCFEGSQPVKGFQFGDYDDMLMIRDKYLAPFTGEDNEYLEYVVRRDEKAGLFLCVYDGMDLKAAIWPVVFRDNGGSGNDLYTELSRFQTELYKQFNDSERVREKAQAEEAEDE